MIYEYPYSPDIPLEPQGPQGGGNHQQEDQGPQQKWGRRTTKHHSARGMGGRATLDHIVLYVLEYPHICYLYL